MFEPGQGECATGRDGSEKDKALAQDQARSEQLSKVATSAFCSAPKATSWLQVRQKKRCEGKAQPRFFLTSWVGGALPSGSERFQVRQSQQINTR